MGRARKPKTEKPAAAEPGLRLEWRSPAELAENPENWRRHPDAQIAALTDVIAEVGWAGACLFNERTGRLIDGHARRAVALSQGAALVPVLVGNWTEEQERKILATLDPLAAMADADPAKLAALLSEIDTESESIRAMLDDLAAEHRADDLPEPGDGGDEWEPGDVPTRAKPGSVWLIDRHRLYVGDANDDTAARLKPTGAVTLLDPPYEAGESVWLSHLSDPCILFGQGKHLRAVPAELYRFERVVDKVTAHRSATVQVGHRHAFVIQCGSVKKLPDTPDTYPSVVQNPDRPDHPHEKPVWLIAEHLTAWTPPGPVWEPFAGGGSGLVAAHRCGRAWAGCELNPAHADTILARAEAEGLSISEETKN